MAIGYILLIPSAVGIGLSVAIAYVVLAYYEIDYLPFLSMGLAMALAVCSFVAGLLGWLLIMKKRVLQCSICGATVSAS